MIRIRPKSRESSGIDMTPLLDCIFILLLFFVVAAAFTVRGLEVDLPQAHSTRAVSGRVVEVRLLEDGSSLVDDVPVARDDLAYKVTDIVKSFRSRPGQLVLFAAPKAPVESLIFLVDTVRRSGGEKLLVATSSPVQASGESGSRAAEPK